MNIHFNRVELLLNTLGHKLQDIVPLENGSFINTMYDSKVAEFLQSIDFPDEWFANNQRADLDQFAQELFDEVYQCYLYYKAGQKNFYLTDGIFQQLAYTQLKGAPITDLQIPYQTIFLSFPETVPFYDFESEPILGAYVSLFDNTSSHHYKELNVTFIKDKVHPIAATRKFVYNEDDDLMKSFYSYMKKSKIEQVYQEFHVKLYEIVINTLLYVTTKRDYIARQSAATSKRRKKNKSNNYIVGNKIVINNNMPQVVYTDRKKNEQYTKHIAKWIVRGHWRNQAHGENLSKRKLIWIEPYVKGEGISEVINSEFIVK